ncbi:MAG: NAD-dependent epimerase/dehydratase family protein [Acidimicrobiales bacterium]
MKIVVTGGAGFIGSNLTDALLAAGHDVTVLDNFCTGQRRFLEQAAAQPSFRLVELDLLRDDRLVDTIDGAEVVVHLAANADVRFGWDHPGRDVEQNLLVTHRILEACRTTGVGQLLFSSTGSVYGETDVIPTPEDCPFPVQTSLYGASKAAAEGFAQAYAEGTDLRVTIFRFVSIMGPRYTHGHVIDFVRKLRRDHGRLDILGDGTQRKSYLDVSDCVAAVMSRIGQPDRGAVFNLGTPEYCTVTDSATWICGRLGVEPQFVYSGGDRGWIGDNPFIFLDTAKITGTGWQPRFSIREAVERTVDYLLANEWLLELEP